MIHNPKFMLVFSCLLLTAGIAAAQSEADMSLGAAPSGIRTLQGQTVSVAGKNVSTWAKVDAGGVPVEVGVAVPYSLLASPPAERGSGPAGALAVVAFPKEVQNTSVFNHFEIHWEATGHTPEVFMVPHFDLHFFRIAPEEVAAISAPDAAPPAAAKLPRGIVYGGEQTFVPHMGTHALNPADLGKPFSAVMILGYAEGEMIFVEPMVTQALLSQKKDISLDIPAPAELGGQLYYPSKFTAHYDGTTDSYRLVMSGFTKSKS